MSARVSTSTPAVSACSGLMYAGVPTRLSPPRAEHRHAELRPERLRDAEVDDLRLRPVVLVGHEHVRRLHVAMDHALLVRVLHRLADGDEELEPLRDREAARVAVLGDREAARELHGEEGLPVRGDARVEDARDAGVVHERERLPLRFEAREHFADRSRRRG